MGIPTKHSDSYVGQLFVPRPRLNAIVKLVDARSTESRRLAASAASTIGCSFRVVKVLESVELRLHVVSVPANRLPDGFRAAPGAKEFDERVELGKVFRREPDLGWRRGH